MGHINSIKTDPGKEAKGVWVDFAEGIRLRIARANNSRYRDLLRELSEPHLIAIRAGSIDPEINVDVMKQVRSKTILLDWENITDDNGEVEYSSEKALEFFRDPELRDFYLFVIIQSENIDLFRKQVIEDTIKN